MDTTFAEHTLPNGLRIICEVMPDVRSAALGFLVRTGSRHERPGEHGVSHFLEHMCFKGTASRSYHDINVRFDELGAMYNAYTSKERTFYYGWVPAGNASAQLELLADIVQPALPEDQFQMERNVILEEIAMSADSFDHQVLNAISQRVYGAHPLAHEVLGEQESIEELPHSVMQAYMHERYAADNISLICAGAVEPEAIFAEAGRRCGDWRRSNGAQRSFELPKFPEPGVHVCHLPQFQQQSVVLAFPGPPRGDALADDVHVFEVLFGGSNSRLHWNVEQKGVCTDAGVFWMAYKDTGMILMYADGEPDRTDEMLAALLHEAREIYAKPFEDHEIQRVKNIRRTHLSLEAENPNHRLNQIVSDLADREQFRPPDARLAAIERVNAKSLARFLEAYRLDAAPLVFSCGPNDQTPRLSA